MAGAPKACRRSVSGAVAHALFGASGIPPRRAPLAAIRVKAALG